MPKELDVPHWAVKTVNYWREKMNLLPEVTDRMIYARLLECPQGSYEYETVFREALNALRKEVIDVSDAAARDVLAERKRQRSVYGWTSEHDDQWTDNQLPRAAICYLIGIGTNWPWSHMWWKPGDRRRNLVKAAALIIAEIERLDRQSSPKEQRP